MIALGSHNIPKRGPLCIPARIDSANCQYPGADGILSSTIRQNSFPQMRMKIIKIVKLSRVLIRNSILPV
jgi:hypothetical protein